MNEESDDDFGDPSANNWRLRHITETTILTVQLIVEFSKRLPGFQSLCREDQITLLKACSSEVGSFSNTIFISYVGNISTFSSTNYSSR